MEFFLELVNSGAQSPKQLLHSQIRSTALVSQMIEGKRYSLLITILDFSNYFLRSYFKSNHLCGCSGMKFLLSVLLNRQFS